MRLRPHLYAAAVVAGLAVVGMTGASMLAYAQTAAPAAQPARPHSSHIEGRIAFLKTELKITDAQQAQWDKVAAAMRENSQAMHQAFDAMRANRGATPGTDQHMHMNAVQHMEASAQLATLRAQGDQHLLDAFKP